MPDQGARPDQAAIQSEQRERIGHALDALPPKARTIIMLSDVEGLSYREIADVLGCPIGTVMSRLHNARKRLKTILGPMVALLLWVGACLLGSVAAADAEPMIRFGVRVLQASNSGPESASPSHPPGPGAPSPVPGLPPPGPPPPLAQNPHQAAPSWVPPTQPPQAAPGKEGAAGAEDEGLKRILPQLRMIFRYNDYTTLSRHRVDGPLGMPQRFPIAGERWLEVTPDQMQGQRVRMRVRLYKGDRPEMNASIIAAPGAPAVVGGPSHGNGVLIIILWARPSPVPGP